MLITLISTLAIGSEGMWLPEQVPEVAPAWADRGLTLDPSLLSDPLQHPLGAIVWLGGCSASFVSKEGLIATNHHCVEGYLQQLSDAEVNRHEDGYKATTRSDELSVGPRGKVWVVEAITDVTEESLAGVGRRTKDKARRDLIDRNRKELVKACEEARDNRRCWIRSYDGGGSYRLFDALEIKDLRLVYAEPMGVGQFGGEIDNWMWPRHSADFAFLRAYVAPDGTSAPYAEENVPYAPAHVLETSTEGVAPGDFVMIAGYPGGTSRRVLAADLQFQAETFLSEQAALMREVADILKVHSESSIEAAGKLGPSISGLENYWKNTIGTLEGLERGGLVEQRVAEEAEMRAWIAADRTRQKRWGKAIAELDERGAELRAERMGKLTASWAIGSADLLGVAYGAIRWADERTKPDLERDAGYQDRDRERRESSLKSLDRSLHMASDREVFTLLLKRHAALDEAQQIPQLTAFLEDHDGIEKALDMLYADERLLDVDARLALMDQDLETLRASDNPWIQLAFAIEEWSKPERANSKTRSGEGLRLRPVWYDALRAWHAEQGRPFYQDANSSLRLTFGTVQGYEPEDGLEARPQTRLSGVTKKVGDAPFNAPDSLVQAAQTGPESRYADAALGDVPVNFLADLDITGGNSGSAVLDGQGRWVGLAFDSNWESVAADWVYEDATNRCISVDLRYVFWLLDQNEAGRRVLSELGVD